MDGIINFLKPPGMSSNSAVGRVKRLLDIKKAGHAGTLDPAACGVLVILIGRATKLSDWFMNGDKEYYFEAAFGVKTDTQDVTGTVTATSTRIVSREEIQAVLPRFTGEILQTPPAFSAISINGRRAYQMARSGETVSIEPRKVTIHQLELIRKTDENRFLMRAVCSKGTYIRTLVEDIGNAVAAYAFTSFLERTRSGGFDIAGAVTADEMEEAVLDGQIKNLLIPMEQAVNGLAKAVVDERDYKRITNGLDGQIVSGEKNDGPGPYMIYCGERMIGLGEIKNGRGTIHTLLITG